MRTKGHATSMRATIDSRKVSTSTARSHRENGLAWQWRGSFYAPIVSLAWYRVFPRRVTELSAALLDVAGP
jgi:hypothetical protein